MADPADQGVRAPDPNHNAIPDNLVPGFDPVYIELYNKYNRGKLAVHQVPIEDFRKTPAKYLVTYGRVQGPEIYKISDLKCPVKGGEITIRVYQPGPPDRQRGAYINIHGGGWVLGNLLHAEQTLRQLVTAVDCVAFDIDYRLAPEHPYPACVDDCSAAYQWVRFVFSLNLCISLLESPVIPCHHLSSSQIFPHSVPLSILQHSLSP